MTLSIRFDNMEIAGILEKQQQQQKSLVEWCGVKFE